MRNISTTPSGKILFFLKSLRFLRNFKSAVVALLEDGYSVHVVFDSAKPKLETPSDNSLNELSAQYPFFSWSLEPIRPNRWSDSRVQRRNIANYRFMLTKHAARRYIERSFQYVPKYIKRAVQHLPFIEKIIAWRFVGWILALAEKLTPADAIILKYVREYSPDLVLVSFRNFPCISSDLEYIKAAKKLGIPCVALTSSWDQFGTKSQLQVKPDKVLVWNEFDKTTVMKYHGISRRDVIVTGAPHFDMWFNQKKPRFPREEFCSVYSLPKDRQFLFYTASAVMGDKDAKTVLEMRNALDASTDKRVRDILILYRPYPGKDDYLHNVITDTKGIKIWPSSAESYRTLNTDMEYYDPIFHSLALVAIEGTSCLDAITIGRPCMHCIYASRFFRCSKHRIFFRTYKK